MGFGTNRPVARRSRTQGGGLHLGSPASRDWRVSPGRPGIEFVNDNLHDVPLLALNCHFWLIFVHLNIQAALREVSLCKFCPTYRARAGGLPALGGSYSRYIRDMGHDLTRRLVRQVSDDRSRGLAPDILFFKPSVSSNILVLTAAQDLTEM